MNQNISHLIEQSTTLLSRQKESITEENHKVFFFGNVNDAYPRALILDEVLAPKDKFTWQILRLHSIENQGAVFPSYSELQKNLSPCQHSGKKASRKTVSLCLLKLRLTRWLSLCKTVRNTTGVILGNIYALHDEPLTFSDAVRFDATYFELLKQSQFHKNEDIRYIASTIITQLHSYKMTLPCIYLTVLCPVMKKERKN